MLALIAGTGALPAALVARLQDRRLICAMVGFAPEIEPDITFRIEHLGSFLDVLSGRGVTEICMAGAVRRLPVDPTQIDAATAPLVPQIQAALTSGDDGALRVIIAILEARGFAVKAAHEIAPDLLPEPGVLTRAQPSGGHHTDASVAEQVVREMGKADTGQACIVRDGEVVARETSDGTDVMLTRLKDAPDRGVLFKAPKPTQDRRADLPVIGPGTARHVIAAGLDGIVIEAGGVIVLDQAEVIAQLDAAGRFLWVRPR